MGELIVWIKNLDRRARRFYLLVAKSMRMFCAIFALHLLIEGDAPRVIALAAFFLICDSQVRVTRLEQEIERRLEER